MRLRPAVALVTGLGVAVAAAVIVTAVRSEAIVMVSASSTSAEVVLARVPGAALTVTVPGLSGVSGGVVRAPSVEQRSAAQPSAGLLRAAAQSGAAARSRAAARSEAAASQAAAQARSRATTAQAAKQAGASRAAAASRAAESSSASASRAAATSSASASIVAASSASASEAAASSASSFASAAAGSAAASSAAPNAAAAPAPDTTEAVDQAVEQATGSGIEQSVVVLDRQTGSVTTSIDADRQVPSMSLVKLMLAADVIDRAGGVADVDSDTLGRLREMIAASDDSVAQDFYDDGGRSAIIARVVNTYGLRETSPAPDPQYWGDVRVTAGDVASFLFQVLDDPGTGPWFIQSMAESADTAADGFDQDFGVNSIPGTGSKQGWGCCLAGVMAIHSVGFTAGQIVVVLSTSQPDASPAQLDTAAQLTVDPGAQAAVAAATRTVVAAVS